MDKASALGPTLISIPPLVLLHLCRQVKHRSVRLLYHHVQGLIWGRSQQQQDYWTFICWYNTSLRRLIWAEAPFWEIYRSVYFAAKHPGSKQSRKSNRG